MNRISSDSPSFRGDSSTGNPFSAALIESLIIGAVTLAICLIGLFLGRTIGRRLDRIAPILGGIILIGIGVEIFLTGIF